MGTKKFLWIYSRAAENKTLAEEKTERKTSPIVTSGGDLPEIRLDNKLQMEFRPIEKILEKEPENFSKDEKDGKIKIMARQRSEFAEMLRQQHLERDSVIGFSFSEKAEMRKDGHAVSFGESGRTPSSITDQASLDREISLLRNRMLRVQSMIRQTEMEIGALCSNNDDSTGNRLKINYAQARLSELRAENRVLSNKLYQLQHKKR